MMPDGSQVERAIRSSYAPMMLNAVCSPPAQAGCSSSGSRPADGGAEHPTARLFPPQDNQRVALRQVLRDLWRNRPIITLALVHTAIVFGGITGPFNPTYYRRDVGVSYVSQGKARGPF
jgi:hypothetical protein